MIRLNRGKMAKQKKPVVLISGAAGNIGSALARALKQKYTVVGCDVRTESDVCEIFKIDLTEQSSIELALGRIRKNYGSRLASVIHLAAYFDFSGEDNPLYEEVNEKGTENLLRGLQNFEVEQFIYASTMLVHKACEPGELIDETTAIEPGWAYPQSKARTEKIIANNTDGIPYIFLRLAGLYDEKSAVPTLSQQIARIYERDLKSHLYSGEVKTGQSFVHRADMVDAFLRTVDRRDDLESGTAILIGETHVMSYQALQDKIGALIHGEEDWLTLTTPQSIAKVGAWLETASEPIIPDEYDQGEKPFIRPFMIDMASDHYALDTTRARELLDWEPEHRIDRDIEVLVGSLRDDPVSWYKANGMLLPTWLAAAAEREADGETIRSRHERNYRRQHQANLWAHFCNVAVGFWLVTSPPLLGYAGSWVALSDYISGTLLVIFAFLSFSWRLPWARFVSATIGCWVLMAPLVTWTDSAAAYLNSTLCGLLVVGFALAVRPSPGISATAEQTGPSIPKGWEYNPSGWFQRLPVIALALVGLIGSRYLTAYQLETIPAVWEPFFGGIPGDGKNGTEEIITSSVSEAWPVPDAGVGAVTYALEIIVGIIGSERRWRTMPWITVLFGLMIIPLGAVSIFFIIIQPIIIGTYCTICLILAAAMLLQIPYSVDEIIATCQFLKRRHSAGQPVLRIFFTGDTDEGRNSRKGDDFEQAPLAIVRDMLAGGMSLSWGLIASAVIAIWLMFTPLLLSGISEGMASVNHLVGALVLTVVVSALATVIRAFRLLNILLGTVLLFAPFFHDTTLISLGNSIACGLALIIVSIPRGPVNQSYGSWDRYIV